MNSRLLGACLILSLVGPALGADPCRLFLIGDSIMYQYRPFLEKFVPATWVVDGKSDTAGAPPAANNLDVPTGANGGDSGMVLSYLQARAAKNPIPADILLLNCGLHDMKTNVTTGAKQVTLPDYRKNLQAIVATVRRMHIFLVWVRTTPVVDALHNDPASWKDGKVQFYRYATDAVAYNAVADEVMTAAHVPMIDLNAFSQHFLPDAVVSHVHYNPATQEKQAAYITGALATIRASIPPVDPTQSR